MGRYKVVAGQNLYDIALHIYGSIEGITDLLICNPALTLDEMLHSGQELLHSDEFEINSDVVAWFHNHSTIPASGERTVYPKIFTLPFLAEILLDNTHATAGLTILGRGELEIDWGDNTPAEKWSLDNRERIIKHSFDNAVVESRHIRFYGNLRLRQLDITELHPTSIFLFGKLINEQFTLRGARVDLSFISLLDEVRKVDLSGTDTNDLCPLLLCKSLSYADLSSENLSRSIVDDYLIAMVEKYYGRRNCEIILSVKPSGEYREPERDEDGRYRLQSGMEAVWVLTHEQSWNEAGAWLFNICGQIYTYEKE